MITGDNIRTAAAIAAQCGILPKEADVDLLVARGGAAAAEIVAAPAAAATQPYPGASHLASPASTSSFDVTTQPASTTTTTAVATGSQSLPATTSVHESVAVQPVAVPAPDVPYLVMEGATFRQLVLRPQDGSLNRDAFQVGFATPVGMVYGAWYKHMDNTGCPSEFPLHLAALAPGWGKQRSLAAKQRVRHPPSGASASGTASQVLILPSAPLPVPCRLTRPCGPACACWHAAPPATSTRWSRR